MRRRLALFLLLPLAALVWLFRPRVPADHLVTLRLGPAASTLRQADLHFQRDGSLVRDLTLHFAAGAPAELTRTVRLAPGDYEVGIRLVYEARPERHVTRSCKAGGDESGCEIDLR